MIKVSLYRGNSRQWWVKFLFLTQMTQACLVHIFGCPRILGHGPVGDNVNKGACNRWCKSRNTEQKCVGCPTWSHNTHGCSELATLVGDWVAWVVGFPDPYFGYLCPQYLFVYPGGWCLGSNGRPMSQNHGVSSSGNVKSWSTMLTCGLLFVSGGGEIPNMKS